MYRLTSGGTLSWMTVRLQKTPRFQDIPWGRTAKTILTFDLTINFYMTTRTDPGVYLEMLKLGFVAAFIYF